MQRTLVAAAALVTTLIGTAQAQRGGELRSAPMMQDPGYQNQSSNWGQNYNYGNQWDPGHQNWNQGTTWNSNNNWNQNWGGNQNWGHNQGWNQNWSHSNQNWSYQQPRYSYSQPSYSQRSYSQPQVVYSQQPIRISMPVNQPGMCSYVLSSGDESWNYTIAPGKKQDFKEDRVWKITFDRGDGFGQQSYGLKPGHYRFRQGSRGWELYKSSSMDTASTSNAPPPPM